MKTQKRKPTYAELERLIKFNNERILFLTILGVMTCILAIIFLTISENRADNLQQENAQLKASQGNYSQIIPQRDFSYTNFLEYSVNYQCGVPHIINDLNENKTYNIIQDCEVVQK